MKLRHGALSFESEPVRLPLEYRMQLNSRYSDAGSRNTHPDSRASAIHSDCNAIDRAVDI
jgi:hypothetical protein